MRSFQLLQYNAHKSWSVMATFLRDTAVLAADIIAIQEPWRNEQQHTTHQPATTAFQLVYPAKQISQNQNQPQDPESDPSPPGICFFVSRKIDPSTWSCQLITQDYQLLKLRRAHIGKDWTDLFIHNVYNRPGSDTLVRLRNELARRPLAEHIVVGDMNAHHPTWGGPGVRADDEAEQLLQIADEQDLELTTEQGKATWTRNNQSSVIDLTFISSSLNSRLICCERADDIEQASDHFPIRMAIDIETPIAVQQRRRNWKATDNEKLVRKIEEGLRTMERSVANHPQIEAQCQRLMEVVQSAIDFSTPWANPSVWSNPDFDDECKAAVKDVRRLRRIHTRTKDPCDWIRYSEARNKKTRLIKKTLSRAHRRRVQQVIEDGPQGMWRLVKWARHRDGAYEKGLTPSLKIQDPRRLGEIAETVDQKAEAFRAAFFPQPPQADLSDTSSYRYPQPIDFPPITAQEIHDVVRTAKAGKAPGDDGIPNSLWHKLIGIPSVLQVLEHMFNACIRTGYNPTHFQRSITVVLRKQGKSDYQLAKSYRPVALLNTLGKFLEAVIARRISYAVETEGLLPKTHLGGRRGISTDHAIHIMVDRIKLAWGKGKPVVSLLMLDVSGAYDNVSHDRLLHNLKKRKLGQLVPWVEAFLSNRSTKKKKKKQKIRMPEGTSDPFPTHTHRHSTRVANFPDPLFGLQCRPDRELWKWSDKQRLGGRCLLHGQRRQRAGDHEKAPFSVPKGRPVGQDARFGL